MALEKSTASSRSVPHRRSGCLTCRQRKVKCDEQKPWCYNCRRLRLFCGQAVAQSTANLELPQPESRATPAIVAECATENIVRSIYPQPPGSAVPPGWRALLDHYERESVPILCSYDDHKNPMRTLYFPIAMSDEATFYALLALSAIHRARRFSSLTDQQQALKLESKSLEALQSHLLQSPETEAFSHDGTTADDRTSILTAVTVLMGTRYLDRDMCVGGGFADHVRGFWTLLRHFGIAHKLDEIPTGSLLFEAIRIGCFFTACALMEGFCDAESPVMWRECQSILARAGEIDYHAGYCYRQLGVLAEVVELERQPQLTPELRERATRIVRKLTHSLSDGILLESNENNGYHGSVERAFKLGLAIRLRVSVLRVPPSSPMVISLVQSALAEFQQNQDLGGADAFSLRALFDIGKACTDPALREFISMKFAHIAWRGYGTVDLYRRQLESIWSSS